MAEPGAEGEAQAVCQVEGCDDPPGYLLTGFLAGDIVICTAHYREVALDLKKVQMKADRAGPLKLEGVKKL